MLSAITRMIEHDGGDIAIEGRDIHSYKSNDLAKTVHFKTNESYRIEYNGRTTC